MHHLWRAVLAWIQASQPAPAGRTKRPRNGYVIAAILIAAAAGCGTSTSQTTYGVPTIMPTPLPSPDVAQTPCVPSTTAPTVTLVDPAPGATAVPIGIGHVTVSFGVSATFNAGALLVPAPAATTPGSSPGPMPTPFTGSVFSVPPFTPGPSPVIASAPLPMLSPATTYRVDVSGSEFTALPSQCQIPIAGTAGTFTTR